MTRNENDPHIDLLEPTTILLGDRVVLQLKFILVNKNGSSSLPLIRNHFSEPIFEQIDSRNECVKLFTQQIPFKKYQL